MIRSRRISPGLLGIPSQCFDWSQFEWRWAGLKLPTCSYRIGRKVNDPGYAVSSFKVRIESYFQKAPVVRTNPTRPTNPRRLVADKGVRCFDAEFVADPTPWVLTQARCPRLLGAVALGYYISPLALMADFLKGL